MKRTFGALAAMGGGGLLGQLGAASAQASVTTDYQALVCIFLYGGNDCHATLVPNSVAATNPTKGVAFDQYFAARGGSHVFYDRDSLDKAKTLISSGSDSFYLHPELSGIAKLYSSKRAAILANVGCLRKPTTKAEFAKQDPTVLPEALFSHSDQTSEWQAAIQDSTKASSGWGGRVIDQFNTRYKMPNVNAFNAGSNGLFTVGKTARPLVAAATGDVNRAVRPLVVRTDERYRPVLETFNQFMSFDNGVQLVSAANELLDKGAKDARLLSGSLGTAAKFTNFDLSNALARQLQLVAQVISVSSQLAFGKQIFFVSLGGFDTHGSQGGQATGASSPGTHPHLMKQLNDAVVSFDDALASLSKPAPNVTTFTCSEFGRALQPSGTGTGTGTDHGWGGHQFIIGNAVKGGKVYGTYPDLTLGKSPDFATERGTLIPTTSVLQYGATLAKWLGVAKEDLVSVMGPDLENFSGNPVLEFL